MMEYKLNILRDILKFSKRVLSKEELEMLISSPLFKDKNCFTSAALLVKKGSINIEEFLCLQKLSEEELNLFLEPMDDNFNYFLRVRPEDILSAFLEMEEYIRNNPVEALNNKRLNDEIKTRIKEFYQIEQEQIKR